MHNTRILFIQIHFPRSPATNALSRGVIEPLLQKRDALRTDSPHVGFFRHVPMPACPPVRILHKRFVGRTKRPCEAYLRTRLRFQFLPQAKRDVVVWHEPCRMIRRDHFDHRRIHFCIHTSWKYAQKRELCCDVDDDEQHERAIRRDDEINFLLHMTLILAHVSARHRLYLKVWVPVQNRHN